MELAPLPSSLVLLEPFHGMSHSPDTLQVVITMNINTRSISLGCVQVGNYPHVTGCDWGGQLNY